MIKKINSNATFHQLNEKWQSLPIARQRMLIVAFAALLLGLMWALIYQPIQASRAANKQRIHSSQLALAQMQRDAAEFKALNTIAPVAEKNIKANIDNIRLEALFGSSSKVTSLANGDFQIVSNNLAYVDWLTKTDELISRYRVSIVEANIKRAEGSLVNATLTLKATR